MGLFTVEPRQLFHVDDAPPRRRGAQQLARAIVGAPPPDVALGTPGAFDEVRAYAARIERAWNDFFKRDVEPWFNELPIKGGKRQITTQQQTELAIIRGDFAAFATYKEQLDGVKLFGASAAWQLLYTHEETLRADRERFRVISEPRPMVSPTPAPLEKAGGVPSNEAGGTMPAIGSVPWKWIAGGAIAIGAGIALSSVARLVRG